MLLLSRRQYDIFQTKSNDDFDSNMHIDHGLKSKI